MSCRCGDDGCALPIAEPGTTVEAFIPIDGSQRSRNLLADTIRRLNLPTD